MGRIHVKSWQEAYRGQIDQEVLDGLDPTASVQAFSTGMARGERPFVAESDGKIVGFAWSGKSRDNEWGELYSMYVDPEHWGEGHGHRLLIRTELFLVEEGFGKAMLWVLDTNARARRFYERQLWFLGRQIKLEEIGGRQVTEVRYEKDLRGSS